MKTYRITSQGKITVNNIMISKIAEGIDYLSIVTEEKYPDYTVGNSVTSDGKHYIDILLYDADELDTHTEIEIPVDKTVIESVFANRYGLELVIIDLDLLKSVNTQKLRKVEVEDDQRTDK